MQELREHREHRVNREFRVFVDSSEFRVPWDLACKELKARKAMLEFRESKVLKAARAFKVSLVWMERRESREFKVHKATKA